MKNTHDESGRDRMKRLLEIQMRESIGWGLRLHEAGAKEACSLEVVLAQALTILVNHTPP
jgi:hypothetical protein